MMGIGAAGVYSISAKFGLASQLIYTAFTGGFQFFAFSAMKEKDQVETNSAVFEYLGIISFIATAFICAWCYPIIKTVFEEEYLGGYLAAPCLFLAPLLQMLFQVAANQFLVIKKTWPNFIISALGVGIHLLLNTVLIPVLGIEGAAVSMLAGYVIANLVCVIVLTRMKLFVMTERFPISVFLFACYMLLWRMFFSNQTLIVTCGAFILLCIYIIIYRKEIEVIFHLIGNKQEKAG